MFVIFFIICYLNFLICVPYECSLCFYYFLHMFVAHGDSMVIVVPMHATSLFYAVIICKLFTLQCHMSFCLTLQQWQAFRNNCFVSHNFQRSYNTMDVVFNIFSYNWFKQEMQWEIIISLNSCNVFINKQVPQYCHEIFCFIQYCSNNFYKN
jgi:hypothetical protein